MQKHQVAVLMKMQGAIIPYVNALWNSLILMGHVKQVNRPEMMQRPGCLVDRVFSLSHVSLSR